MRILCFTCGRSVSSELPDGAIFRAIATCPECIPDESDERPALERELLLELADLVSVELEANGKPEDAAILQTMVEKIDQESDTPTTKQHQADPAETLRRGDRTSG